MRRVPLLICLAAVASACAAPAAAQASGPSRAEVQRLEDEGVREIIVARDPGLSAAARGDVRAGAGVTHVEELPLPDTEVVRAPAGGLVEAVDALETEPGVRYAEPNAIVRAASNDPFFSQQWGLENTGQPVLDVDAPVATPPATVTGTVDADIDAPQAWTRSTGAGQAIGVVDTGFEAHVDLANALWTNPGEAGALATNGLDDDNDGAADDLHGWNALLQTTDFADTNGHGTHVSGTIAARADNGLGVAGVAPAAQVFPLVALNAGGIGDDVSIARAFDVAGRLHLPIVNASLAAPRSQLVEDVVLAHPATLYVLAAGNAGDDLDSPAVSSLCQMPEANVICVGASDANDARAPFSNHGATNVDLFAPGDNILSTFIASLCGAGTPTGCYAYDNGTSMAAPHVSGTLALMRALDPSLGAPQLATKLLASVDRKDALTGLALSNGRLNAAAAVAAVAPAAPAAPPASAAATAAAPPAPADATPATTSAAAAAPVPVIAVAPVLGHPTITAGALTARRPLTIRFTLDRAATVKVTIVRGTKTVATVSLHGRKGANRYVLRTKVGAKRLTRGRYRVRVSAAGAATTYTLAVTVR